MPTGTPSAPARAAREPWALTRAATRSASSSSWPAAVPAARDIALRRRASARRCPPTRFVTIP
ncbi:hypothetical protein QFZ76_008979 [Streptomyces sp. V4I2]|nr:hypothetical protein [Streptomyces sp. V4I2]